MRNAWKLPAGVAWPRRPVETGQLQRVAPSTDTVMRCVDLSMVMMTFASAAVVVSSAARATAAMASVRMTGSTLGCPSRARLSVLPGRGNDGASAW